MPWLRLLMVSIVVEPIWNGLLVLAGYRLGDSVAHMERGMRIGAIAGSVIVFFVLLVFYRRMFGRLVSDRQDGAAGGGLGDERTCVRGAAHRARGEPRVCGRRQARDDGYSQPAAAKMAV